MEAATADRSVETVSLAPLPLRVRRPSVHSGDNQPTGAQERHDYLPINVDYTLADFKKTSSQLREILYRFGEKAGMERSEVDDLFMGQGFERLVLASGGVPRDFLSLLLQVLSPTPPARRKSVRTTFAC
jgi:hypothetical protein